MKMMQCGVEVDILPNGAKCKADEEKRSPLDIEVCPCGYDICTGDCWYYTEEIKDEQRNFI